MAKYHSTLSRREFLKALGIGGAGVAAAAVAPPVYRDLDEMMASPTAIMKRPSWVKEVEKPTVEIDWDIMKRFTDFEVMWAGGFAKAVGRERVDQAMKASAANAARWRAEGKPGYTLADTAFNAGTWEAPLSYIGPCTSRTPEDLDIPRWEGTPEQNARLVTTFLRMHGAYHVGFAELDTNTTEKMINLYDAGRSRGAGVGPEVRIIDADQPEEKLGEGGIGGYRILPKKARWVIIYSLRMSPELTLRAPSHIASRQHGYMYDLRSIVQGQLQNFMRTLGYMCLGDTVKTAAMGQVVGFMVMSGMGESCRTMHAITPEFGVMQRPFIGITDLPLPPGKPIDIGVMKFCRTCKKCAEYCPAKAIPMDTEPTWEVKGPYNRPGVKTWYRDEPACREYMYHAGSCAICIAVCPFSRLKNASYTNMWQSTVAKTSAFNRTIRRMNDLLGYNPRVGDDIENIWNLDLPPFGWT